MIYDDIVFKALGDSSRYRIFMLLRSGPVCVCQMLPLLNISGGTLSRHLDRLFQAKLVERRKTGRWIYYSLSEGGEGLADFLGSRELPSVLEDDRKALLAGSGEGCPASSQE